MDACVFWENSYQEIMTDPSYAGQAVCFTCPHIGNVGINAGTAFCIIFCSWGFL
jgi:carbamoylphosphate synthase small subunit